jgi:predicted AlkP superfamily phosphohydrolase/phosphomutase
MVEGIEINLRGRQPQGVVSPGQEYEELRRSIVAGLRELTDPDTGERLVAEAGLREEVYSGPFVDLAPDIVCLFNEGYTGGPEHAGPLVAAARANAHRWEATHRMDGVFIAAGPMVRPNARIAGANIVDVAPTVLYALGLPVPEDMDGRVLTEIFEPSFVEARPVLRGRPARRPRSRDALSPEETEQIMGQLRGLGYL